ncbi:MAG TPA: hypothetical protein VGQ35_02585 [Dongiaceae bacterium]|jgi:hypothetical protein|nr:hypothetical protein [Dongiaceae bacterium]
MKKPISPNKGKSREPRITADPSPAKVPEPAEFAASIDGLADALALLRPVVDAETAAMRERDSSILAEMQPRKSAIIQLLRGGTRVVRAAQRAGLATEEDERNLLLAQCRDMLATMQVNQRAIAAARSATHQRIQSLLQARQRAQGSVLVYGPDGQARASGRWSDRRDLAPTKA